jgi:hypothetical protein
MTKTKMIKFIIAFLTVISLFGTPSFAAEGLASVEDIDDELIETKTDAARFYNTAILRGLNKTTAKTSSLEMKIEDKIHFGQISIIAHKCWQAPLDQRPESKILIEVLESKNNEPEQRIFYGWMFASSPSISGLEHPIYDLTAIGCKNK